MINGKDQEIITINKTGNSILNNAKYSADNTDEWYTTYETIAEELSHYEYYGAAEPPVRCGESHLSGLTEPPHFVY